MTRRMLINAINPAELRVALADGNTLEDFKVDVAERGLTRGNIYFGYIANIQPSLNAAFIDYGAERHGFLPIQDVVPDAYYRQIKGKGKPRIEDVLEKGRPIVVQVTREPEGQKGAALTTNLSLAGRYLVLMPFEKTRGISRKVNSEEERRKLAALVDKMRIPQDCGVIVRTNALEQNKTALTRDLNALLRLWKRIGEEARKSRGTKLLYSDQDIVLQALRDNLDSSIEEVIVDAEDAYQRADEYMQAFMPRSKTQLIRFRERIPIFATYKIEEQIDRIYDRQVGLPSGGSIVIDHAEALTAIDVNSGRSTKATSQEETALNTNLEAAVEVARQLRLRDIGGLIVVDFIDMRNRRNQKKTEKVLRDAMKVDKARFTVGRISSNGLLEINRQRLDQAVQMRTHRACPTCSGTGRIASPELIALHLIRAIEARAAGGYMKGVDIELHTDMADYVQNHLRRELLALSDEFDLEININSSDKLHRPEQNVTWHARDREEIKRIEQARAEAEAQARAEREAAERSSDSDVGDDESQAAVDALAWAGSEIDEVDEDDEDATADSARDGDESEEDRPKKRRRRRRGGRKRRRRSGDSDEQGNAEGDRSDAEDSDDAGSNSDSKQARSQTRDADASDPSDAADDANNDSSDAQSKSDERSGSDEESGGSRRRRPRRRRSRSELREGRDDADNGSDAEAANDGSGSAKSDYDEGTGDGKNSRGEGSDDAGESEGSSRSRRRPRRRRRKPDSEAAASTDEAAGTDTNGDSPAGDTATRADGDSTSDDQSEGRPRRRTSRRRRSPTSDQSNGDSSGKAAAEAATADGGEGTNEPKQTSRDNAAPAALDPFSGGGPAETPDLPPLPKVEPADDPPAS